ncbi:serine hydroxymethyltransferase, partial [Myroides odoratimimus]|nr:serine hydroxymethyltransferase [Myroides odoratimimus]
NMVPYDDKSNFITSGIRVGAAAVTTRGLKEADMKKIVHFIDEVLIYKDNATKHKQIKQEIQNMMKDYPMFSR